jgi:methyl-accepting chemotaxis protein
VTRRLLLSYLALTFVVLAALELPLGILNAHNQRQDLRTKVTRDASTLGTVAEDALEHGRVNDPRVQAVIAHYADESDARVVIRDTFARVVAAAGQPEGHGATATAPIASNGHVLGIVAITYPTSTADTRIQRFWIVLGIVAAAVLGAAAVVGLLLSRSVTRPLRRLESAAERVGEGALDARAP